MTIALPLPTPDADSAPFWSACREGHLAAQRCPACTRFRWPPMEFCPWCSFHGGDWTVLPGTGIIRSFVVVHRAFDPAFAEKVPYVVAHITLDAAEEVTIIGNVVAEPVHAVAVGQRVAADFLQMGEDALPPFRPMRPINARSPE